MVMHDNDDMIEAGSIQSIRSSASNRSKIEELRKKRMEITKKKNRLSSYQTSSALERNEEMSIGSFRSMGSSISNRSRIEELRKRRMEITKQRKNKLHSNIHSSPPFCKFDSMESDSFVSKQSLGSPTNGIPVSISVQTQKDDLNEISPSRHESNVVAADKHSNTVSASSQHSCTQRKNENKKCTHATISNEIKSSDASVCCDSISGKEVLRFGKYSGETFWYVLRNDPTYSYMTMVESEQLEDPDKVQFGTWVRDHLDYYCGCEYKDESS